MTDNVILKPSEIVEKAVTLKRVDFACPRRDMTITPADEYENNNSPILQNPSQWKVNLLTSRRRILPAKAEFSFPMTSYAVKQLNTSIAPGFDTYSRWLIDNGYADLYSFNVNQNLEKDKRNAIIRTVGFNGQVKARAIVSDMFKAIDDDLLLPDVMEIISDASNMWQCQGGQITDTNTYIRFITREPQFTIKLKGDRERNLRFGFEYRNSEVGHGFQQFKSFVFDEVCLNMHIFVKQISMIKFMHKGSKIETMFGPIFEDRIRKQEILNIKSAVVDATKLAVEGAYMMEIKQYVQASLQNEIQTTDTAALIRAIGEKLGLSDKEKENTLVHYDDSMKNAYGIASAITRLAQDAHSFNRRVELEEAGGKLLAMTPSVWKSINALS